MLYNCIDTVLLGHSEKSERGLSSSSSSSSPFYDPKDSLMSFSCFLFLLYLFLWLKLGVKGHKNKY